MNISINMSEVLLKAWKITWKFKILWLFGILASFGANRGGFNGSNGGGGRNTGDFNNGDLPEPFKRFQNMDWQEVIGSFLRQYAIIILIVISLLCILSFFFYFLGVMGKTGLIKGAQKADGGAEKLGFGQLWRESLPYFWRMFGLSLLVGLPIFILIVILLVVLSVGLVGFIGKGEPGAGAVGGLLAALGVFIPAICCLGIVSVFISMVVEQAKNAMVIEDLGVIESLRRGWNVFKRSFLTIILMSILLGVLGGIVSFIVAIPLLLAVLPAFVSIFMLASKSADMATSLAPLALAGICFVAYLPVLLILRGVEQTYNQSALTLTYLRLTASAAAHATLFASSSFLSRISLPPSAGGTIPSCSSPPTSRPAAPLPAGALFAC